MLPRFAWAADALTRNRPFEEDPGADRIPTDVLRKALELGRAAALLNRPEAVAEFDRIERFLREPQRWRVAGPFAGGADVKASLEREVPLEKIPDPGTAEGISWQAVTVSAADDPDQYVDLEALYEGEPTDVVAYALGRAHSERAVPATLLIGSDDGVKVWLNGKIVHEEASDRGFQPWSDARSISLRDGDNTFLVKVANREGHWGFGMSIVDERGMPIELTWAK